MFDLIHDGVSAIDSYLIKIKMHVEFKAGLIKHFFYFCVEE